MTDKEINECSFAVEAFGTEAVSVPARVCVRSEVMR